jgi:PRTRC genetic system protein C
MALKVINTERSFLVKGKSKSDDIKLADPNPNLSPEEVMKFYASEYPQLTSSNVAGPKIKDNQAVYEFQTVIGTKG